MSIMPIDINMLIRSGGFVFESIPGIIAMMKIIFAIENAASGPVVNITDSFFAAARIPRRAGYGTVS